MGRRCWFGRRRFSFAAFIGAAYASLALAQQPKTSGKTLLGRYCTGCHNERAKTAGIVLENVDPDRPGENAKVLEKVLRKVQSGEMPPRGLPRPDPAATRAFTASLQTALDQAALKNPNPGRPAIHRLNRVEFSNASRDLLTFDINPAKCLRGVCRARIPRQPGRLLHRSKLLSTRPLSRIRILAALPFIV